MFGDEKSLISDMGDKVGMAPRAISHLFQNLGSKTIDPIVEQQDDHQENIKISETDTEIGDIEQTNSVFISILQIYNETLSDLL